MYCVIGETLASIGAVAACAKPAVGMSNYTDLLGSSSFWNAFGVSIKWTAASIIGQLAVGLVLALALDRVLHRGASVRPADAPFELGPVDHR